MFLIEDFKEDQETVQRYAAYKKAYELFQKEGPECVIYGENANHKNHFYLHPYGCTSEKLRLLSIAAGTEKRTLLALYKNDMESIWDYLQQGYMVRFDPRLHEDLNPNVTSKEVEQLISDLYELRQNSLKSEGEYGLGNLVFKELRGIGYLDQLKELKKELEGKELSLFAPNDDFIEEDFDSFNEKEEIIKDPKLIEWDVLDMQENDPDKYFYDEVDKIDFDKFDNLYKDLIDRLVNLYKLSKKEATNVVNSYLGTPEEIRQAI